jgi:hypothetical protein
MERSRPSILGVSDELLLATATTHLFSSSISGVSDVSAIGREPIVPSALREREKEDEKEDTDDEKAEAEEKEEPPKPTAAKPPFRIVSRAQSATTKNQARRDTETDPTHKFCTLCLEDLALTNYTINSNGIFGRHPYCNLCKNSTRRLGRAEQLKEEEELNAAYDEEDEDDEDYVDSQSLSIAEQRQATKKNQARRDVEADPTHTFCTLCFQDLALINYTTNFNGIFDRGSRCNACKIRARKLPNVKAIKDMGSMGVAGEDEEEEEEEEMEKEEDEGDEDEEEEDSVDHKSLLFAELSQAATAKKQARRDAEAEPTYKFCTLCLQDKPLLDYTHESKDILGRQSHCRACKNKSQRQKKMDMKIIEEEVKKASKGE